MLTRYRQALVELGDAAKVSDRSVVAIFQNASTIVREPANLRKLIDAIDGLHWFSDERDAFGDAYEGLLQKMAEETNRAAASTSSYPTEGGHEGSRTSAAPSRATHPTSRRAYQRRALQHKGAARAVRYHLDRNERCAFDLGDPLRGSR